MRRLMLLRHAKTEIDAPSGHDQDRRLDDRGRTDAAEIGHWIARHPPLPDLVQVSTAVRAQQTWEIASQAIVQAAHKPQVEHLDNLYGAEPGPLLHLVRLASAADPMRLMLVGHNPGMHELALALTAGGDVAGRRVLAGNFPTSGLAIFDFDIDDWNDVGFRRGQLVLFVTPKLLKQASQE